MTTNFDSLSISNFNFKIPVIEPLKLRSIAMTIDLTPLLAGSSSLSAVGLARHCSEKGVV